MTVKTVREAEMNAVGEIRSSELKVIVRLNITSYEPVHVFWLEIVIDVKSTIVNILIKIAFTLKQTMKKILKNSSKMINLEF